MKTEQIGFQEHVEAAAGKVHVKVACAQFLLIATKLGSLNVPFLEVSQCSLPME